MTFVHERAEFGQLVQIVARATGIAAMYWGPRISLDEASDTIRAWLGKLRLDESSPPAASARRS